MIEQGISGRKALDYLRSVDVEQYPTGLGMRTQEFYKIWTPVKDMNAKAGKGRLVQPTHMPGAGTMTVTPFKQKRGYNYITDIDAINLDTGEAYKTRVTVASDIRLTRDVIESEAREIFQSGQYEGSGESTVMATFSHGTIAKG